MVFRCWPKCCQWNYNNSIIVIVMYPNNFLFRHWALDFICKKSSMYDVMNIVLLHKIYLISCTSRCHTSWCCHASYEKWSSRGTTLESILTTWLKQSKHPFFSWKMKNFNHKPMNLTLKTLTLTSKHKALPPNPKIKLEKLNPQY